MMVVHCYPIFSVSCNKILPHITALPVSQRLNAHGQGQLPPKALGHIFMILKVRKKKSQSETAC